MAWWLLYEELYGNMDKEYPIMSKNDNVTIVGGAGTDTIEIKGAGDYWGYDGISITGNPTASADTINLDFSSVAGADTVAFSGSGIFGGAGNDYISFTGVANTAYDDNKYYTDGYDPYHSFQTIDYPEIDDFGNIPPYPSSNWERIEKPQPDLKYKSQKYQEDKGIADLKDYVSSTYKGHYTNDNSDVQTLDLIHSVGDAESFCRSNALKYLSRYDKKGQAKRDILKAMHYCLLLYYFSGNTQEPDTTDTRYETF